MIITYFEELENKNRRYIELSHELYNEQKEIIPKTLPFDFFLKYSKLFRKIDEYDLLFSDNKSKKIYTDNINDTNNITGRAKRQKKEALNRNYLLEKFLLMNRNLIAREIYANCTDGESNDELNSDLLAALSFNENIFDNYTDGEYSEEDNYYIERYINEFFDYYEMLDMYFDGNDNVSIDHCLQSLWQFHGWVSDLDAEALNLSKYGVEKLRELELEFAKSYKGIKYDKDFYNYLKCFYYRMLYDKSIIVITPNTIKDYLQNAMMLAKYQQKLAIEDEKLFTDALEYIEKYKIEISPQKKVLEKIFLERSYFITPYGLLYSANSHMASNIYTDFLEDIYRDDKLCDSGGYYVSSKETLKRGYTTILEFDTYTNFKDEYKVQTIILPSEKTGKDEQYKIFNPRIVNYIAGIYSGKAGLYSFFNYLKNNSSNYYSELERIKNKIDNYEITFDEILVRCCGFHKVSSIVDKTITTSDVNWENDFKEYIENGWHIDFVKPILLNNGKLEELNDEFLKVKKYHI